MKVDFAEFTVALASSTRSAVAPMIKIKEEKGEKEAYVFGCAVFKADKMVGELDEVETRGYLWIAGEVESAILDISAKGEQATIEIFEAASKVTTTLREDGSVLIKLEISGKGRHGKPDRFL